MYIRKLATASFLCLVVLTTLFLIGCASKAHPVNTNFGSLTIILKDNDNQLIGGAKLSSEVQPEGQMVVTAVSDTLGLLKINDVKAGQYRFSISKTNFQSTELNINIVGGQNSSVELRMMPATIQLTIPPITP
jgi:hypothetical protein